MEPLRLERHVELGIAADELWALIEDPEHLVSWLGDSGSIDLHQGGLGVVIDGGVERRLIVDTVDANRSVAFTWWDADDPTRTSRVVLEIETADDGNGRLVIGETLSADASTADAEDTRIAWEVRVLSLWACTVAAALAQ